MKVVVADKFPESALQRLSELSFEVIYNSDLKGDTLTEELKKIQPEALVVRSTKVTAPMLDGGKLKLVVRSGSGTDTIDVEAATRKKVHVANCPGKNSTAVAELAWALILALDRRIPDNVSQLRDGQWNKKEFSKARGLFGRTLGLVGVGRIGKLMIERAKGFGMPVAAWSRSLTSEKAKELGVERKDSPEEVAAAADVVSVHVALKPETQKVCGEKFFAALRPGAYFINTSRGGVVDENALERAVKEKGIRAGLDVYATEPASPTGTFEDGIGKLPGVYGTHHIGASTDQAQEATAAETVRILESFSRDGTVLNAVNKF